MSDQRAARGPATYAFADCWEAVADRCPQRLALVCGDQRLTYAELEARANRLAHVLLAWGVTPHQHLGLYLENGVEYVVCLLATYKVRAVPINVNYRYVEAELAHLFEDADLVGVFTQPSLVERAEAVRAGSPALEWVLVTGPGGSYEQALAGAPDTRPEIRRSGDDPYVLYTGGTTGLPRGVVWRQEDAFFACIGGGDPLRLAGPVATPAELPDRIIDGGFVYLPVAPLMHAAGQWTALSFLFAGGTVVLLPGSLDPRRVWETVAAERVNLMTVVGDAVLRPLVDEWERSGPYDAGSLFSVASGGAPLTPAVKARLGAILPGVIVADGFGSSETGAQGAHRVVAADAGRGPSAFSPYGDTTAVLDPETLEAVEPGSAAIGRVALRGRIPLRYHKDPERTAATFVEAGGHRWVLTGDLAEVSADGTIALLGRGSQVINTGGEKVFVEEVEAACKHHPDVYDVVVVGVPDERWGSRVVAVVQPTPGAALDQAAVATTARAHLAGFKVPKSVVVVDRIQRSPAGKADYTWAAAVAAAAGVGPGAAATGERPG